MKDSILIVDDSPVARRVLSLTLEKAGFTTLTASDGFEAFDLLKEGDIFLVFCDIHMPGMDGITLLQKIRPLWSVSDLPVVMLTASGELDSYQIAIENGANSVLTKPASSHEVISTANSYLKQTEALPER